LLVLLLLLVIPVLMTGCSGSRTVAVEQELPVGNHLARTVIDSDLLVPQGTNLTVDYSRASRFFIEAGGALTGFPKGAQRVTVFAEEGALIPDRTRQAGVRVRTVEDAAEAYRTRYAELPPVGMDPGAPGTSGVAPVVGVGAGVGFWGGPRGFWRGGGWGRGKGGRAVSARPSSYRRRD